MEQEEMYGSQTKILEGRIDRPAPSVCHSSLFLDNLPALRRRFRQIIQPGFEVDAFDEMFEMEIV
jgi:hypothetical protein